MSYGKLYDFTPKMIQDLYKNIYLYLYNEDGTPNYSKQSDMMKLISGNITEKELEGNEYLVGTATEDSEEELNKIGMDILNQDVPVIEKGSLKKQGPVTFDNLLKGKQIIKKGAKGAVVRDIQRMLASITDPDGKPYKLGTTGPKNDGVDGDFGPTLEAALFAFQIDNDLFDGIDGIVGKETSTELKKKYDERR
jgi:peptidoglycan hydrolase-like protein with peptidoglycan-binding domain